METPFVLSLFSQKSPFFQQELVITFHLPTGQVLSWILFLWPTDTQQGHGCQTSLRQQNMQLTVDCLWNTEQRHTDSCQDTQTSAMCPFLHNKCALWKGKQLLNQKHKTWSPIDQIQTDTNKIDAWFVENYNAGLDSTTIYYFNAFFSVYISKHAHKYGNPIIQMEK